MAGTVIEGLLLLRMFSLRLQRLYTWLTLYWAVSLVFDAGTWLLGFDTPQAIMLDRYAFFLLAVVFPLAAWDAFEEMKNVIGKLRLIQGSRMVSGIFATLLLGAILFAFMVPADADKDAGLLDLGPIVWFISLCASTMFVWSLRYLIKKQNLPTPGNTVLWVDVFLVVLGCEVLGWLAAFAEQLTGGPAAVPVLRSIALGLNLIEVAATLWALIRLRAAPSDSSPAPQTSVS